MMEAAEEIISESELGEHPMTSPRAKEVVSHGGGVTFNEQVSQSQTMVGSTDSEWPQAFSSLKAFVGHNGLSGVPEDFADVLAAKSQIQTHFGAPKDELLRHCLSSNGTDMSIENKGIMVEELTVINYKEGFAEGSSSTVQGNVCEIAKTQFEGKGKGRGNPPSNLSSLQAHRMEGGLGKGVSIVRPFDLNEEGDIGLNVSSSTFSKAAAYVKGEKESSPSEGVQGHFDQPPLLNQYSSLDRSRIAAQHVTQSNKSYGLGAPAAGFSSEEHRKRGLTSSGFTEFFVNKTMKGKGVPSKDKDSGASSVFPEKGPSGVAVSQSMVMCTEARPGRVSIDVVNDAVQVEVNLRERLQPNSSKLRKNESLSVFKQIAELVDLAHSQGVLIADLWPSSFTISLNRVKYVGSSRFQVPHGFSGSNSGSVQSSSSSGRPKRKRQQQPSPFDSGVGLELAGHSSDVGVKIDEGLRRRCEDGKPNLASNSEVDKAWEHANVNKVVQQPGLNLTVQEKVIKSPHQQFTHSCRQMEERWYASPEGINDADCAFSSNIYSLGVLLFELFCCFDSWEVHSSSMSDLRHRILPPFFLAENPKEAGFCLWLLHPEPSCRPRAREILQSALICETTQSLSEKYGSPLDEEDADSELLLHFLSNLREKKHVHASKLVEDTRCLVADIEEVEKRHSLFRSHQSSREGNYNDFKQINTRNSGSGHDRPKKKFLVKENTILHSCNEARILKNIFHLENAYFSMRSKLNLVENDNVTRTDTDVLGKQGKFAITLNDYSDNYSSIDETDPRATFFDGFCKYARYSKFEVRGSLRSGDLVNSANVICSLSFDRDEEYFAAAGVSKKIKIFEFKSLLNSMVDIHYPAIEMSSRSKLSCVCWNNYIKNFLASTDYDGVVQLWDATTGQGFLQYAEHQKRAWSADFSQAVPTKLASGSDDCSVKLWSINEKNSISTIRNMANICCVQFSRHSAHLLAVGSADYKVYCYDLRNTRVPWCTLAGHSKAVSYVKFLDPSTIVSASTDNTLKIWDLAKTNYSGLSADACSLTLNGHCNEKNFVGLSVSDGYIACGSETNEVYSYYKSLPMPITSHKFGSIDPVSGLETGDDGGLFVSSVCWKGNSNMIVAANSNGNIKLLQLV